jgi:PIN domain nuclease of toxin-antitoxin system
MNLLLDTLVLLRWLADDNALTDAERAAIAHPESVVFVSSVSAGGITIKASMGKLDAPENLTEELFLNQFQELPVRISHGLIAGRLPRHHRDPFDRMLIAQAILEDLTLVTHDQKVRAYDVHLPPT